MRSGVRPACERHPGSRVQFFGRYGAPGRERQRFRCLPADGAAHTFTEPLPRLVAGHGDCVECERSIDAHQGPQAPRCYRFPAREIARTLVGLGQGQTYRQAAERARGRLAGGGESRHGQLAADWVEVLAADMLLARKVRDEVIVGQWEELLRLAGSIKRAGSSPASC